jgi:hypothetical protein
MISASGSGRATEFSSEVLVPRLFPCYFVYMSTLDEIEAAADVLTPEQKQELLLFLAMRLRAEGATLPEPRTFPREQIGAWVEEDEADMRRFNDGK